MIRKYMLPLLAVAGVLFAIHVVIMASKPVPAAPPVVEPAPAPFRSSIAGAGIIEASTQNIAIGTPVPGIVTRVFVRVGSTVKAEEPLFKLDDRDLQAELAVRHTALQTAKNIWPVSCTCRVRRIFLPLRHASRKPRQPWRIRETNWLWRRV